MTNAEDKERLRREFDHHSGEFAENYLEVYRELREQGPLLWTESHEEGYWVATDFKTIRAALMDGDSFVTSPNEDRSKGGKHIPRPERARLRPIAIPSELGGREHSEVRGVLHRHFSQERVAELEPMIRRHARASVDQALRMSDFDVIYDLASPVVAAVVNEHLGLGHHDPSRLFRTIHAMVGGTPGDANTDNVVAAFTEGWLWISGAIDAKRQNPADDVISALLQETDFPLEKIQSIVFNIVLGGADTAANLTAYALLQVEARPDLREVLRADPGMMSPFLDEVLRTSDIVMAVARTVTRDIDFAGVQLAEGDRILLPLPAANHDPGKYADPDTFDLKRGAARHVATGAGAHFCLGASLGKALAGAIVGEVLATGSPLVFDGGAERKANKATQNIFESLRARFSPAGAISGVS